MEYDRMLAELFGQEDQARQMAHRLADLAKKSRESAAAERASLLAFLRGPMERHFHYEETVVFPKLEARGLGPEVQVATKQHEALRQLGAKIEAPGPEDDLGKLIFEVARLMLHHTNFEGDYIYPELTHADWRELMKETVEQAP
jgi:hemerythrin-like domain-containing protein